MVGETAFLLCFSVRDISPPKTCVIPFTKLLSLRQGLRRLGSLTYKCACSRQKWALHTDKGQEGVKEVVFLLAP